MPEPVPAYEVPPETTPPEPARCASCGERLAGPYCHACGERVLPPGHLRIGRYLRDAFEDLTSADGAFWRSLRALLLRPGLLTREWLEGRRQPYLRPIRFFLIVNVVFFLFLSFAGGSIFRGQIESQRSAPFTGAWSGERFERAVAEAGVSEEVYTAAFNQHADTLSRTIIALLVPLLSIVFGLLLAWRRVPAVTHVVFATHFVTGMMALTVLVGVVSVPLYWLRSLFGHSEVSIDVFIMVAIWLYLVLAARGAYKLNMPVAFGTGTLGMAGLLASVVVFQFLLFQLTVWTLQL